MAASLPNLLLLAIDRSSDLSIHGRGLGAGGNIALPKGCLPISLIFIFKRNTPLRILEQTSIYFMVACPPLSE